MMVLGIEGLSSDDYFPGEVVHEEGDWALIRLDGRRKWDKEYIVAHKCRYGLGWKYSIVDLSCFRCGEIC